MTRHRASILLYSLLATTLGAAAAPLPPPPPPPPPAVVWPSATASPSSPTDLPTAQPSPTTGPQPPYVPNMAPLQVPPQVTLPPPAPLPPDVPQRPLTMDEAVAVALHHQPSIDVAAANVDLAEGRVVQTAAALHPTVTVAADYTAIDTVLNTVSEGSGNNNLGANQGASGTGSQGQQVGQQTRNVVTGTTGLDLTVTGRQLIFDFNHTRDLVRQAEEQEHQAQASLTQAQADQVLTVKQNFVALVQDQRLIQVQVVNVQDQAEHLRQAEGLYRAGTGLPSDVVQAQAALADAINSLVSAENTSDTARITLARSMGIDPRTPLLTAPSEEAEVDDHDLEKLIDIGLVIRPEVVEAQDAIKAALYGLSAARTTSAPTVAGSATLSSAPFGSSQLDTFSADLSVAWPLVDGGLTRGLTIQARATLQQAYDQLRIARVGVIGDATTAYLALHTAQQRLDDVAVEVRAAQENLRLQSGRYTAGLGTALDVLDAEAALVQALTNQVNALADVDNARASLLHAVGTPPPAIYPLKPDQQNKVAPAGGTPAPPFPVPPVLPSRPPSPPPNINLPPMVIPGTTPPSSAPR